MAVAPGWYKDPADPTTQRYWDGEGWVGEPIPADAQPPEGPPAVAPTTPAAPTPVSPGGGLPPASHPAGVAPPAAPGAPLPPGPAAPQHGPVAHQPGAWPHPAPDQPGHYPPGPYPPGAQPPGPPPGYGPPGYRPPGGPFPYPVAAPAPRPHGLPLASPGARLVARLVDIVVVAVLALVANGWFLYQLAQESVALYEQMLANAEPSAETAGRVNTLTFLIAAVSAAVWLAYEVPSIANTGQTLGKRLLGIKVMRIETTDRVGFGRALGRWTTLGLPTLLWPCYGVGLILQIVDCLFVAFDRPLHQALHDKRALTVVVQTGQETPKPDGGTP